MKQVKYLTTLNGENKLHISQGNSKTGKGIITINLLPGDKPLSTKKIQLTNIAGSCAGCCAGCKSSCYAIRQAIYKNTNIPAWADNTALARYDLDSFFFQLQNYVNKNIVAVIRIHSFGEFLSKEYLNRWFEFAERNSNIQIYAYTKRFAWLEEILADRQQPGNLTILASIWHKNYNNPMNLPEFIYDDGTEEELKEIDHCPAVDEHGNSTGVTCAMCKRCVYAKRGDKIAVYAH